MCCSCQELADDPIEGFEEEGEVIVVEEEIEPTEVDEDSEEEEDVAEEEEDDPTWEPEGCDIPIPTSDEDWDKDEEEEEEEEEREEDEGEEDGDNEGAVEEHGVQVLGQEEEAEELPETTLEDGSTWKLVWVRTEGGSTRVPLEVVPAKRLRTSS